MRSTIVRRWGLRSFLLLLAGTALAGGAGTLPVRQDPLVRMPGTQPGQVSLLNSATCQPCHGGGRGPWVRSSPDTRGRTDYREYEIFYAWQGSMMGNAARDPLMFACLTLSAQDSLYALGNTNATDICLRCHLPKGWLESRSDPPNASLMDGEDYDGVQCTFCHALTDPFFQDTFAGTREGHDWGVYWDEQNVQDVPKEFRSKAAAVDTRFSDWLTADSIRLFSGAPFYRGFTPGGRFYGENAGGQYFVSPQTSMRRGPFADAFADRPGDLPHSRLYSRYHKSKFFCSTCHDVSNPALANLAFKNSRPGDPVTLPTETLQASLYSHVERTFSEFRLSAYDAPGGAAGKGPFAPNPAGAFPPTGWETDQPGNKISKCQDCHMCSRWSIGSNDPTSPVRPEESVENPNTWMPCHAMTGANVWLTTILESIAPDNPSRDPVNAALLLGRRNELTLDPWQGTWTALLPGRVPQGLFPADVKGALNLAATRLRGVLRNAASITDLSYDPNAGRLSFRVQNQTGHKLISGFPEGRRMFVSIDVLKDGALLQRINPYDASAATLKGLPNSRNSPALAYNESFQDDLVYEVQLGSTITGEEKTFHFVLATHRYKDNRIPPKGFRISEAAARQVEPVRKGKAAPDYFTPAEYAGGYDEVNLTVPRGATEVRVGLYYQTTSREYVEFLRDEINGTGHLTLPAKAYVAQSDPYFAKLRAWGETIYRLWENNRERDGAKPILMTSGSWSAPTRPLAAR